MLQARIGVTEIRLGLKRSRKSSQEMYDFVFILQNESHKKYKEYFKKYLPPNLDLSTLPSVIFAANYLLPIIFNKLRHS